MNNKNLSTLTDDKIRDLLLNTLSNSNDNLLVEIENWIKNGLTAEKILKSALCQYPYSSNKHIILEIIKLSIKNGAHNIENEIDSNKHSLTLDKNLLNILLEHSPTLINQYWSLLLNQFFSSNTINSNEDKLNTVKESIKFLISKAATPTECLVSYSKTLASKYNFEILKFALEQGVNPNIVLTSSLNILVEGHVNEILFYIEEAVNYQLETVIFAFAKGANLSEIKLNKLNLEDLNVNILKVLLDHELPIKALSQHDVEKSDHNEVLDLMIEKGLKDFELTVAKMVLTNNDFNPEIWNKILNHYDINTKFNINRIIENYQEFADDDTSLADLSKALQEAFAFEGTLLHVLAKANNIKALEYIAKHKEFDINSLNIKGQTALFFASSPEVVEFLISKDIDTKIIDKNGKFWINSPSLTLINYAIEKGYLDKNYGEVTLNDHFIKGNFEHAKKIFKAGVDIGKIDVISNFVSAIKNGLENSVEVNKFHAISNLIAKAGIQIPPKFAHLVNNIDDNVPSKDFKFIDGLLHKLAMHYINLSKQDFIKTTETECSVNKNNLSVKNIIDQAFLLKHNSRLDDFSKLKEFCPQKGDFAKIDDEFDAYYTVIGKAMNLLDNDFSTELLTINGLAPTPLEEDITVFRGLKVTLSEEDIHAWFKYGIRAFSIGDYQKFLGYYINQDWNKINGKWEAGGTYVSLEPRMAAGFALGITTNIEAPSILLEMKLPKGSPKICGSWKNEYELIPGTIEGSNIVAIYDIYNIKENGKEKVMVAKAWQNPYSSHNVTTSYKESSTITVNSDAIESYNKLGCKLLPTDDSKKKSLLYKDYDDFVAKYSSEKHAQDQNDIYKHYFNDRESFEDHSLYLGQASKCDLTIMCCLHDAD